MTSPEDHSFFARWARRKAQSRGGEPLPEPLLPKVAEIPVATKSVAAAEPAQPLTAVAPADSASDPAVPLPTIEETQALTPASDFSRFVARGVSPEVRNAAVKKLFADPHFNIMDGLDTYIDDYSKPSPLSAADMAQMVSAQFLKLVDDPEEQEKKKAAASAAAAEPGPQVADAVPAEPASPDTRAPDAAEPEETPHHDHADLQLQPDHAPGRQGPGPGAG